MVEVGSAFARGTPFSAKKGGLRIPTAGAKKHVAHNHEGILATVLFSQIGRFILCEREGEEWNKRSGSIGSTSHSRSRFITFSRNSPWASRCSWFTSKPNFSALG